MMAQMKQEALTSTKTWHKLKVGLAHKRVTVSYFYCFVHTVVVC
jgi:hypothetical protein